MGTVETLSCYYHNFPYFPSSLVPFSHAWNHMYNSFAKLTCMSIYIWTEVIKVKSSAHIIAV